MEARSHLICPVNNKSGTNHLCVCVCVCVWGGGAHIKAKEQLWPCDCIVKETLWNRSEKVDHLAYKYLVCISRFWHHQNDKKFGPVLVKLQALYTERYIWDYTHVRDTFVYLSHTNR